MQNQAFLEAFNDDFINDVLNDCTHISQVCIESVASTAYNNVIFEEVLSDEVLEEGMDEFKDKVKGGARKAGNAAYKALEAFKMFFKNIFNKIRVAINEFISSGVEKKTKKALDDYKKNKGDRKDQPFKVKDIFLDQKAVFFRDFKAMKAGVLDASFKGDDAYADAEKKIAKMVAGKVVAGLGANYKKAKDELKDVSKLSDVSKVILNIASKAEDMKKTMVISDIANKTAIWTVASSTKKDYTKGVSDITAFIKTTESKLGTSDEENADRDVRYQIKLAQQILAYLHAAYIGELKFAAAANKNFMAALTQAKKKTYLTDDEMKEVKESVFTEFTGLDLI